MNLNLLTKDFEQKKSVVFATERLLDKLSGVRTTYQNLVAKEQTRLAEIDDTLTRYQQVVHLLQLVAEKAQYQITRVETICSDALRDILDDGDLTFKFDMERKRNVIETKFFIHDGKVGKTDLMRGEAGGVKNVVAVGLRLVFTELYHPKIEGPIILDEAGGNISVDYQASFGKFLRKFSALTNRQIILVSHHAPVIAEATRKIVVSKQGSESMVNVI